MKDIPVVYVAGPFRGPNSWEIEQNIRRAETLALEVWKLGAAAICPHSNTRFYQGAADDKVWLEGDLAILAKCDALLLTEDWIKSEGAKAERLFALERGIPVLNDILALSVWLRMPAYLRSSAPTLAPPEDYGQVVDAAAELSELQALRKTNPKLFEPGPLTATAAEMARQAHERRAVNVDTLRQGAREYEYGPAAPVFESPSHDYPIGYTKPFDGEIRVTDPKTGGQKGSKPVRFDLIPKAFQEAVQERRGGERSSVHWIRASLEGFWRGHREDRLVSAASDLETVLGGPVAAAAAVARVYGVGAAKYSDDNWRKGYKWSLSYAAALRHLSAIERGEMMDEEMGVPHYANVWWHCATLWTFATEGLGTDDRPGSKEVE